MAITRNGYTIDTIANGEQNVTFSHTVNSGSDRLLIVTVSMLNDDLETVSAITFDGISLTELTQYNRADDGYAAIWYLKAPNVKTANIVVTSDTMTTTSGCIISAINYYGVHQTTTFGTPVVNDDNDGTSTENEGTLDITSATDEQVIGVIGCENDLTTMTMDGDGTILWQQYEYNCTGSVVESSGITIHNIIWNFNGVDHWAAVGVAIKPAPAGTTESVSMALDVDNDVTQGPKSTLGGSMALDVDGDISQPVSMNGLGSSAFDSLLEIVKGQNALMFGTLPDFNHDQGMAGDQNSNMLASGAIGLAGLVNSESIKTANVSQIFNIAANLSNAQNSQFLADFIQSVNMQGETGARLLSNASILLSPAFLAEKGTIYHTGGSIALESEFQNSLTGLILQLANFALNVQSNLSSNAVYTGDLSIVLPVSVDNVLAANVLSNAIYNLMVNSGVVCGPLLTTNVDFTVLHAFDILSTANQSSSAIVSFIINANLNDQYSPLVNAKTNLELANVLLMTNVPQMTKEILLTLNTIQSLITQAANVVSASLNFDNHISQKGYDGFSTLRANAQMNINSFVGLLSGSLLQAGFSLGSIQQVNATYYIEIITPTERIYIIVQDPRIFEISKIFRTYVIPEDERVLEVQQEQN